MHDLWLRVCALLDVDPATVKMPHIFPTSPGMIYAFSGERRIDGPALYEPNSDTVMILPDCDRGAIAHEFAHAIGKTTSKFYDPDCEDIPQWVEQNI